MVLSYLGEAQRRQLAAQRDLGGGKDGLPLTPTGPDLILRESANSSCRCRCRCRFEPESNIQETVRNAGLWRAVLTGIEVAAAVESGPWMRSRVPAEAPHSMYPMPASQSPADHPTGSAWVDALYPTGRYEVTRCPAVSIDIVLDPLDDALGLWSHHLPTLPDAE